MKPRTKNDSWFYYGARTGTRQRIRRIAAKRRRWADRAVIKAELAA